MSWLTTLSHKRQSWLLLAVIAAVFEATALYFQYAMDLAPCIMCIYQRTAMLGVMFAGIVGAIGAPNVFARVAAYALWLVSAIWGYLLAKEHLVMQTTTDPFAFVCEFEPNFPSFMPLHEWLPSFFAATGDCGNIDWQFMNLSMPAWMEVIFMAMSAVAIFTLVMSLFAAKEK